MNKKQFEDEMYLKELNKFLRANGSRAIMKAEKDANGDYRLKWEHDGGTLPETLQILKVAKPPKEQFYKELREKQIKNFYEDKKSNPSSSVWDNMNIERKLKDMFEFAKMNVRGTLNERHLDIAHKAVKMDELDFVIDNCIDPRVCEYAKAKKELWLNKKSNPNNKDKLLVKIDGQWKYVFANNQEKHEIITTNNKTKALSSDALNYFQRKYANDVFKIGSLEDKKSNPTKKDKLDYLIEDANKMNYAVTRHPRKKTVSINGKRAIPEKDAIRELEELVLKGFIKDAERKLKKLEEEYAFEYSEMASQRELEEIEEKIHFLKDYIESTKEELNKLENLKSNPSKKEKLSNKELIHKMEKMALDNSFFVDNREASKIYFDNYQPIIKYYDSQNLNWELDPDLNEKLSKIYKKLNKALGK